MKPDNFSKLINPFRPKLELLLLATLLTCETARASVGFTITPASVSNTYYGTIQLLVTNLTPGETVTVQIYLDANTNGVVDAGDILVQQFNLTDGTNTVIGGVTNINVPGDTDNVAGQITAKLNFQALNSVVGQYLFVLSTNGLFTPLVTNSVAVTNYPYAQKFTGMVVSNGAAVPNAGVFLTLASGGKDTTVLGSAVANDSGIYTIPAPAGTYSLFAFKSNFVANTSAAANLVLSNNATFNTNLTLIAATQSISGSVYDTNNTNIGLPGIFTEAKTTNKQVVAFFSTETNGNFTVPVTSNAWQIGSSSAAVALHGYVGLNNNVQANVAAGSVSNLTIALPKATALFYGTVLDSSGNPLTNGVVAVYVEDQNNTYQSDGYTESNGYYVTAALGLGSSDPWYVQIDNEGNLTNYIFSQPDFDQNGLTNLNAGQAIQVNFTALLATNQITGYLLDCNSNPLPNIGINASATISNLYYQTQSSDTGTNGYYSLNVASGYWNVNVNCACDGCGNNNNSLPTNYACPNSDNVTVSNNNQAANFTAVLATNSISGYLLDNNSNPIPNVAIYANPTNSQNQQQAITDTNGYYSINVSSGYWSVSVNCPCSGCYNYNFLSTNYLCPNSTNVTVSSNNVTVDFTALDASNYITGYLTNTSGVAITNIGIYANATINGLDYGVGSVYTDSNGHYALNVANGTWSVCVNNCTDCGNGNILSNYLNPPCVTVVISNDNGTADFTAIPATNYITGYLKDNNSNAIPNVSIVGNVTISNIGYFQDTSTDTNGNYSMNVANGTWTVGVNSCSNCGNGLPGIYCPPQNQMVVISNDNRTADFTVQSGGGVTITTTSLPSGQVNSYYNQYLQASSCCSSFTWLLISNSLPAGLNYSSSGEIYGTPTNSGTSYFTFQVTDCNNNSTNRPLSIYIAQTSAALQITTTSLSNATQNAFYSTTLTAAGGLPSYTWGLLPGSASLPSGLALATNGVLSGTPIGSGTASFIPEVSDMAGASNYQILSLTINTSSIPQMIVLTVPEQSGIGQFQFYFKIAADLTYTVQSSKDLKTWSAYETFNLSNSVSTSGGIWTVTIPDATNTSQSYYRVMMAAQ
jgi:hypothetical protein